MIGSNVSVSCNTPQESREIRRLAFLSMFVFNFNLCIYQITNIHHSTKVFLAFIKTGKGENIVLWHGTPTVGMNQ